jgi:hypothetical protein
VKKKLDEALVRDFPNLYRARHNPKKSMIYGFDVSDHWEPLLRRLSEKLEALILQMPEKERENYYCVQLKSKFASLRCYMSAQTDEMTNAIRAAEEEAYHTCENCGKPGTVSNNNHWLRVECDRCMLLK